MGGVRMCACQSERVRRARGDVVQYCYDVMQWRWFYVSKIKTVFITFALTAFYATGIHRIKWWAKAKGLTRFYKHVFVFTYNLFWIIRVKVEILMEVTIHIYCFFVLFAHLLLWVKGGKACEWQVWSSVFLIYLELSLVPSQVCIFLYFIFHIKRELWVWNAVNINGDMLGCCVALGLAVHTAELTQVQNPSEPQPSFNCSNTRKNICTYMHSHTQIYQHIHLHSHNERTTHDNTSMNGVICFQFLYLRVQCIS